MKLAVHPETILERIALWLGIVPEPLFETHISATLARTVMAGTKLGLFECLADAPLEAAQIAQRCGTELRATVLLLDALAACGYLALHDGRYALVTKSRKWLLRASPHSVRDKILFQESEWHWLTQLEAFVHTGEPLDFHAAMSGPERDLYHRSMRAIAGIAGREVGLRTPVPPQATTMLDLGGSHGHFAASICRRHPQLQAQVMDFPDAIESAAPLLAAEGLGDRVVHVAGDVTRAALGSETYDLIFMSNLAHHLDDDQNRMLAQRVASALRPGGVFVIQEAVRATSPSQEGQTGALLGLYFALQSRPDVNSWTTQTMRAWQADAGLHPRRATRLHTAPGWVQQTAYC